MNMLMAKAGLESTKGAPVRFPAVQQEVQILVTKVYGHSRTRQKTELLSSAFNLSHVFFLSQTHSQGMSVMRPEP